MQVPRATERGLRVGDYFSTAHDLYRIEELHGDYALVEDCRTEIVLDIAVERSSR